MTGAPGDVVVAIDGVPVDRWLAGRGPRPAALRAGTELHYEVLRGGEAIEIPVRLRRDTGSVVEHLRDTGTPLAGLLVLTFGAYAVLRRPEHPAARALLLLGGGLTAYDVFSVVSSDVADLATARWVFVTGIAGNLIALATWNTAGAHLVLSFPTPVAGLQRRPRVIVALYAAALSPAMAITVYLAADDATLRGLARLHTALVVSLWALVALSMLGLLRLIVLMRRDPATRRQAGLVVLGMGTTGTILAVANVVAGGSDERWPVWFAALAFFPMIAALAAAIVRGGFLDIRATINRAFVYVALTGTLLALFAATATVVGAVVGRSGLAQALPATAVVAVAFAPTRSRVQHGIDRLLYGERGDPARVLGALGQRLESALPSDQVLPAIVETLALTLRFPYVAIRMAADEGGQLACERGEPPEFPEALPLVYQGDTVGALIVGPRRGERALSESDHALLTDVARHAAAAVSASRLLTEIAASRSRLAVAREEERARLRHDLHDRLGAHLAAISLQLDSLEHRLEDRDKIDTIRRAQSQVDHALDEVRRISRGLRPTELEELGLVAAIGAAAARMTVGDADREWHASVSAAVQLPAVPAGVEAAAYHIAVEALTNAYRHSGGNRALIRIGVDALGSRFVVEISDNGTGISRSGSQGVGLRSMKGRAVSVGGALDVSNLPHGGTVVRAELPLDGAPGP